MPQAQTKCTERSGSLKEPFFREMKGPFLWQIGSSPMRRLLARGNIAPSPFLTTFFRSAPPGPPPNIMRRSVPRSGSGPSRPFLAQSAAPRLPIPSTVCRYAEAGWAFGPYINALEIASGNLYGLRLMTIHCLVPSCRGRPRACPTSDNHKGCPYHSTNG